MADEKKIKTEKEQPFYYKLLPAKIAVGVSLFLFIVNLLVPVGKLGKPLTEERVEVTASSLVDRTFAESVEDHLNNGFLFKNALLYMRNNLEVMLGSREINNVLITPNRLLQKTSKILPGGRDGELSGKLSTAERNLTAVGELMRSQELPVYLGLIPSACDIYKSEVTNVPDLLDESLLITRAYEMLPPNSGIDIYTALNAQKGEQIFYYTDTRWTSYGSYIGYNAVMKGMGKNAIPLEYFNIEHAAHEYYGNLYQETYIKPSNTDVVDLYHYAQGTPTVEVSRYADQKIGKTASVFAREYLEGNQEQSVFLGEPCALTRIQTNLENGENILIFKDSFTDPMIQFLMLHYENITLVDLELINTKRLKQLNFNDYSSVLLLYSVPQFITDNQIYEKLNWLLELE